LSISSTVFGQVALRAVEVAGAGVARAVGLLTGVCGLLAILIARSGRGAAHLLRRARLVITRFAHLLIALGSSLRSAFQGSARATIEAARTGVTRGLALLPRLSVLVSILFTVSRQALGRVARLIDRFSRVRWGLPFQGIARGATEAGRAGVTGGLALLLRLRRLRSIALAVSVEAAGRVITASRALSRPSAGTSRLRQTKDAAWTTRPLLWVCSAIASLAVLVAVILFSAGERLSPDVRRPVDGKPILTETSTPNPVSAPPVGISRPESPHVAMRPKRPETQTEILAPLRRPDPAVAQSRATATAPGPSTETAQNGEASDSTAAIDWLLKGGSSRRRIENP
jgi:hypothetical protein